MQFAIDCSAESKIRLIIRVNLNEKLYGSVILMMLGTTSPRSLGVQKRTHNEHSKQTLSLSA